MFGSAGKRVLFGVLKTPEKLQGQFVGQEHGGAHGETSDGVHRHSPEENLQEKKTFLLILETVRRFQSDVNCFISVHLLRKPTNTEHLDQYGSTS